MFRLISINIRFAYLTGTIKKSRSYLSGNLFNNILSITFTTNTDDRTSKIFSARDEFIQNMKKYYQSSITGKGNIAYLASTNPHNIDIYVNHNDYLNLSFNPQLMDLKMNKTSTSFQTLFNQEKKKNLPKQGSDNLMSGVFLHEDCLQYEISDILAKKILDKESVYITQSGYIANYSLLQSLVIPSKTHVYIDSNAHESLWQGARRGIIHKIKHNSFDDLKRNLDKYGSGIIVTDSLYSSRGSIADLVQICNLKEQYDCILVVDESHSIGMYGPNGRGLAALENVTDHIDFITGSLAKVYCVRAGFIAGRTKEVLYTREISSAAIFSSALMNWDMQRLQRAIDIVYHADNKRERLLNISKIIRQNILMLEFNVEQPILPSPIICIIGGPNEYTKKLQIYFENAGISAAIFIPPATPSGQTMLRITLHAGLSDQDVTRIIDTFKCIAQHRLEFPYTFKLPRHK